MDDDELDRRLLAADPARTAADAQLTPAQVALRNRIMQTPLPAARHRLPPVLLALPLAAVLVLVLAVVAAFPALRAEAALTPPPIGFTNAEDLTVKEVVDMATENLRTATGPALSRQTSSTGWYMQIAELPAGRRTVAISPQVTTMNWEPDGSGTVRVVAGIPYWADGSNDAVTDADAPAAGTVLRDEVYGPGEMAVPPVAPSGDTPEAMLAMLTGLGLPADHDGADVMDFIDNAMRWWTFDNAQQGALLRLVLAQDDIRVLGTGTDRAGREVLGITAESRRHPDISTTLLVSAETGRIVGTESTRITADGDIPAGAVIAYTMWEVQ